MHYQVFQNESYPTIPLDEILKFIYYINWFEINSSKKTQYTMYWEWFEFKSEYDLELFNIFLKLYLEFAIDLEMKEIWNDNQIINKNLKWELDKYWIEDSREKFTKILLKQNKKYDLLSIFHNWEHISNLIKKHDWFDISLSINWNTFLNLFFRKITQYKGYNNINKNKIINELYENISNKLDWDINSSNKIEIFYTFENYLENSLLVFPLLKELEINWNLKISSIVIKQNYIYFYLENFIDFKKNIILKVSEKIIKNDTTTFEYKNNIFYINNEEVYFKSNSTKIFDLFRLIFDAFIGLKSNNISIVEFIDFYKENKKKYKNLSINDIKDTEKVRINIKDKCSQIEKKGNIKQFIGTSENYIQCKYFKPE